MCVYREGLCFVRVCVCVCRKMMSYPPPRRQPIPGGVVFLFLVVVVPLFLLVGSQPPVPGGGIRILGGGVCMCMNTTHTHVCSVPDSMMIVFVLPTNLRPAR